MNTAENRLIAEFMNFVESSITNKYWTNKSSEGFGIGELVDLQFHSDWNWLMKVVEKIESTEVKSIRYIDFHIMPDAIIVTNQDNEENPLILINRSEGIGSVQKDIIMFETKIEAVYNACCVFIEWYNNNNNNNNNNQLNN